MQNVFFIYMHKDNLLTTNFVQLIKIIKKMLKRSKKCKLIVINRKMI